MLDPDTYGVESGSDGEFEDDDNHRIVVPNTEISLSKEGLDVLKASINPLQESSCYGADIYMRTVNTLYYLMTMENLIEES